MEGVLRVIDNDTIITHSLTHHPPFNIPIHTQPQTAIIGKAIGMYTDLLLLSAAAVML